MNRYSMESLAQYSDLDFACRILQERLCKLSNPYSPLSSRLQRTILALKAMEEQEKARPANYWTLTFTGPDGQIMDASAGVEVDLNHIAEMIRQGATCGVLDQAAEVMSCGNEDNGRMMVKAVRKGSDAALPAYFFSLAEGDVVFLHGQAVIITEAAHYSGDATYDGWLAYGRSANDPCVSIFPEDCDVWVEGMRC